MAAGTALTILTGTEAEQQLQAAQAWGRGSEGAAGGGPPAAAVQCDDDDMIEVVGAASATSGGDRMGMLFITPPFNAYKKTIRLSVAAKRLAFFTTGHKFLAYEVNL